MNTMKNSSKVLISFYHSSAYELEYSFHVIILTYKLAYSFCVMILTCRTLSLIIHMTYVIRIRAKLRWQFIVPLGLPMSYACRSKGSMSWGDMGSFFVHECGAQAQETFGYDGAPWLRGRRQVVTTLSIPCNLPCSGIRVGVHNSPYLAGRPVLGDLPIHLTLSSNSNHIACMIINYSLHSYI